MGAAKNGLYLVAVRVDHEGSVERASVMGAVARQACILAPMSQGGSVKAVHAFPVVGHEADVQPGSWLCGLLAFPFDDPENRGYSVLWTVTDASLPLLAPFISEDSQDRVVEGSRMRQIKDRDTKDRDTHETR